MTNHGKCIRFNPPPPKNITLSLVFFKHTTIFPSHHNDCVFSIEFPESQRISVIHRITIYIYGRRKTTMTTSKIAFSVRCEFFMSPRVAHSLWNIWWHSQWLSRVYTQSPPHIMWTMVNMYFRPNRHVPQSDELTSDQIHTCRQFASFSTSLCGLCDPVAGMLKTPAYRHPKL